MHQVDFLTRIIKSGLQFN